MEAVLETKTQAQKAGEIEEMFELFDEWEDKYQVLIDLGKDLPPMDPSEEDCLPVIGWPQLERQLRSLAGPDGERASWEMEVLRVSARTNPPEMFFRDLLTLAWSLIDGTRPPRATEDAMD